MIEAIAATASGRCPAREFGPLRMESRSLVTALAIAAVAMSEGREAWAVRAASAIAADQNAHGLAQTGVSRPTMRRETMKPKVRLAPSQVKDSLEGKAIDQRPTPTAGRGATGARRCERLPRPADHGTGSIISASPRAPTVVHLRSALSFGSSSTSCALPTVESSLPVLLTLPVALGLLVAGDGAAGLLRAAADLVRLLPHGRAPWGRSGLWPRYVV